MQDALTRLHGYRADVLTGPVMLRQTVQEYRQTAQLDGTQTTKIKVCHRAWICKCLSSVNGIDLQTSSPGNGVRHQILVTP